MPFVCMLEDIRFLGTNFGDILMLDILINENASEDTVCEVASILSRRS